MARPRRVARAISPADEVVILREFKKRHTVQEDVRGPSAKGTFAFLSSFFPAQRRFASDPAKRKAGLCTRRAGKSTATAGILIDAAQSEAFVTCIYIGLTRRSAKKVMWKELLKLDRKYSLGMRFNKTELTATLRNGSTIVVCGATDDRDIDRLRGEPFLVCVIDEAGAFPEDVIEVLIHEVLSPATLDFDGTIIMIGTPTAACAGLFFRATTGAPDKNGRPTPAYDATTKEVMGAPGREPGLAKKVQEGQTRAKGWSVHKWTVHENPYVPRPGGRFKTAAAWLAWMREEEGLDEGSPAYRREYCGEWVRDETSLVYPEIREASAIARDARGIALQELPLFDATLGPKRGRFDWRFGVGVDLGYDDPCSITLLAWCEQLAEIWVAKQITKSGMIPSQIAAALKSLEGEVQAMVGAPHRSFDFVVVDQGGGTGKMVSEEFVQIYQINAEGAEKPKKETFLRFVNGDFRAGRIKIIGPKCPGLFEQLRVLQWDPKKPGREDPRFANDKADSFLYGVRKARTLRSPDTAMDRNGEDGAGTPAEVRLQEGTPEAFKRHQEAMFERAVKKQAGLLKERKKNEWWKPGGKR